MHIGYDLTLESNPFIHTFRDVLSLAEVSQPQRALKKNTSPNGIRVQYAELDTKED